MEAAADRDRAGEPTPASPGAQAAPAWPAGPSGPPTGPVVAAAKRYRAMAYAVGTLLIVLVFVAMPIKYIGGQPALSSIVSPLHGFLYMVYLAFAFDLYRRASWPLSRMVVMVAAGLVPFLAFFIERKITHEVRAGS